MTDEQIRQAFAYALESMYLTYGSVYATNEEKRYLQESATLLRNGGRVMIAPSKVDGRLLWPLSCDRFAIFWQQVVLLTAGKGDVVEAYDKAFNAVFAPSKGCTEWLEKG